MSGVGFKVALVVQRGWRVQGAGCRVPGVGFKVALVVQRVLGTTSFAVSGSGGGAGAGGGRGGGGAGGEVRKAEEAVMLEFGGR